jgi:hypothetical protein
VNDLFEKKVRAAAVAGWWVILIGYALLTLIWGVYLVLVSARPEWMRALWGQTSVGTSCKSSRSGFWASSSCSCGI